MDLEILMRKKGEWSQNVINEAEFAKYMYTKLFDNQKENVIVVGRGSISKEAMPTAPQISTKMFRGLNKVLFQFER